jgi:hypothetical protein
MGSTCCKPVANLPWPVILCVWRSTLLLLALLPPLSAALRVAHCAVWFAGAR